MRQMFQLAQLTQSIENECKESYSDIIMSKVYSGNKQGTTMVKKPLGQNREQDKYAQRLTIIGGMKLRGMEPFGGYNSD